MGEGGKSFYRDDIKNSLASTFKSTGNTGIMAMALTDLTGDNEYVIGKDNEGNDIKAGNLSFKQMWEDGVLNDKFYKQIPKGTDTSWMWDKSNVGILNDMMSEYYTDVAESSYNEGKANYKPPSPSKTGKSGKLNLGKSRFGNDYIYMEQRFVNNKLQEFNNAKEGDFISGFEGANTYGFKIDKNKNFIYQEYNPKTGKFEGDKKFNIDNAITQLIPSHYLGGGSVVKSAADFN